MANSKIIIESRVQLFSILAEAAELEHNFMCLYLYAMMGLKRSTSEGVTEEELAVIDGWRRCILEVSLEEMTHLALVSNLFTALGSNPHFSRPNFPVFPGMYPENIIVELAKFDLNTLDHFIYLERPRKEELRDGASFEAQLHYNRVTPEGRLMAYHGDYDTIGDLYQAVRESVVFLSEKVGEKELFCGDPLQQIGPADASTPGLIIIKDKASALQAIDTIVTQGEGALEVENSHFARFKNIKREYLEVLKKNPAFDPSRPVARNPLMRPPISSKDRVYVDDPTAAQVLDLSNSLYMYMLKALIQFYTIEGRTPAEKEDVLSVAFAAMHLVGVVGEALTYLPASQASPGIRAGMSFSVNRFMSSLSSKGEAVISVERMAQIQAKLGSIIGQLSAREEEGPNIKSCNDLLKKVHGALSGILNTAVRFGERIDSNSESADSLADVARSSHSGKIQTAESDAISVSFESIKCIHARHCVTQLPGVFLANTPGRWIRPENSNPDDLAAIIRQCPSGALNYKSRSPQVHDELAPEVNLVRLRENGPYAFLADLEIDGKKAGFRATLCRCGKSANKPYCDSAHNKEKFTASGEPESREIAELKERGGPICIRRIENGPLAISGNLEICAGSGKVITRTTEVHLCRCGHSKAKPVCDGSHIAAQFRDSVKVEERQQSRGVDQIF